MDWAAESLFAQRLLLKTLNLDDFPASAKFQSALSRGVLLRKGLLLREPFNRDPVRVVLIARKNNRVAGLRVPSPQEIRHSRQPIFVPCSAEKPVVVIDKRECPAVLPVVAET